MGEQAAGGRYGIPSEVRYRLVGGEAVVLRVRAREVLVLNEVGGRILQLVDETLSAPEIVERLLAEFEVDREVLTADVAAYLEELVEAGVVEPVASAKPPRSG